MENAARNRKEREKKQIQALRSGNVQAIKSALEQMRATGTPEILPEIFKLMIKEPEETVYNESVKLLNDLKYQDAANVIMDAIENKQYSAIRKDLVSSCWQNRLDFHEYIETFVHIAIMEQYEIALESYSVIEDAVPEVSDKLKTRCIQTIRNHLSASSPEKRRLLEAMADMIQKS